MIVLAHACGRLGAPVLQDAQDAAAVLVAAEEHGSCAARLLVLAVVRAPSLPPSMRCACAWVNE
eukprot:5164916-Alexandrium_andersonii.AAC.1